MSKKKKFKQVNELVTPEPVFYQPLIPAWLLILLFSVWLWLVVTNYFRIPQYTVNLANLPQFFTALSSDNINFGTILTVWIDHISAIFIVTFLFTAMTGYGWIIRNLIKLPVSTRCENFVFSFGLGTGVTILMVTFIGMLGWLYPAIIGLLLVPGLGFFVYRLYKLISLRDKEPLNITKSSWPKIDFFILNILIIAELVNLVSSFAPETFFDALVYHLNVPQLWIFKHRISPVDSVQMSYYPLNIQVLYTIGILFKDEKVAKLIHFVLHNLTIFTVFVAGRKFFSFRTGLLAATVFATIPLSMFISWRSATEHGLAFFELIAVFALLNALISEPPGDTPSSRSVNNVERGFTLANPLSKWLILCGIFIGLAIGGKYTSILGLVCLSITYFCLALFWQKKLVLNIIRNLALIIIPCLLITSHWFLRNLFLTGNPVYPYLWGKDFQVMTRSNPEDFIDPPRLKFNVTNFLGLPWKLTMAQLTQEPYAGPVILIFIPLLFLLKKTVIPTKMLVIYSFLYYTLWFFMRPYLRYFSPALPVLSLTLVQGFTLIKFNETYKKIVTVLISFICLGNVYFALSMQHSTMNPWGVVTGVQTKLDYLNTQRPTYPCPYYGTVDWLNQNLPKTVKVMFIGETRGYYCKRPYIVSTTGDFIPFLELCRESNDGQEFRQKLINLGITHLLLNVPEANRLKDYNLLNFKPKDLVVLHEFWTKYVREIYKSCAYIQGLPRQSDYWKQYSSDPRRYVFLYEILDEVKTQDTHPVPLNFFLLPDLYSPKTWAELEPVARNLWNIRGGV